MTPATLAALAAIAIWSTVAVLSTRLAAIPPFLLVGIALCVGGLVGLPKWRDWRVPLPTLALGCYGLFGYHFCLFMALRFAPPIEANLINYLWPLLIVLLAPAILPDSHLSRRHVLGGLLGLAGCVVIVLSGGDVSVSGQHGAGYALAAVAAVMWATYTLLCQRVPPFKTGAIGGFCLASGLLALFAHGLLEPAYSLRESEWLWVLVLGIGPMGVAFFLWDFAFKRGDARALGTLAYITPLLSTTWLAVLGSSKLGVSSIVALCLILAGAWLGNRTAS